MIRDVVERFRYRFELWRREQGEASFWRPGPRPADLGEPTVWQDPKYDILWTESTPSFIIREVSLYVGIVLILANVGFVIDRIFPSARHAVSIAFIWLVGVWTFLALLMAIDMVKKRKAYRLKPWKSSNQALEQTADRCDV